MLPAPVRVTSQRPLAPKVPSVTSVANDTGVNDVIPEALHGSGIYRMFKENIYRLDLAGIDPATSWLLIIHADDSAQKLFNY